MTTKSHEHEARATALEGELDSARSKHVQELKDACSELEKAQEGQRAGSQELQTAQTECAALKTRIYDLERAAKELGAQHDRAVCERDAERRAHEQAVRKLEEEARDCEVQAKAAQAAAVKAAVAQATAKHVADEARAEAARAEAARAEAAREEAARAEAARAEAARDVAAREVAAREEAAREVAVREEAAREEAAKAQAAARETAPSVSPEAGQAPPVLPQMVLPALHSSSRRRSSSSTASKSSSSKASIFAQSAPTQVEPHKMPTTLGSTSADPPIAHLPDDSEKTERTFQLAEMRERSKALASLQAARKPAPMPRAPAAVGTSTPAAEGLKPAHKTASAPKPAPAKDALAPAKDANKRPQSFGGGFGSRRKAKGATASFSTFDLFSDSFMG